LAYRVLIVDDSPAMRSLVRRLMKISGFDVASCLEASDGTEALELLKTERVDAILSDINMPRMDGEELLRRLEADESLRRVPVIVISTDGTRARVAHMLELGARGYLKKPFRPEDLRAELQRNLEAAHE
jgi:two-component system, chemotaxis family, chemotaxis protein CheY